MRLARSRMVGSVVTTVLLVAGCGSSTPTPPPPTAAPSASAVSVAPTPTTAPIRPTATLRPSGPAPDGSWSRLDLVSVPLAAELTADVTGTAGADPSTTFTFHSLDGTPAATAAARLTAEPAITWAVETGADAATARLRPAATLARGTQYRFTLTAPDGAAAGEWVFRTAGPPRVVATIPGDETTDVPLDRAIEITFDRDGVTDPSAWFSIKPATKGHMEHHGRAWVFVPDGLRPSTLYTVALRPGIPIAGTGETTQAATRIRFATAAPSDERAVWLEAGRTVVEAAPGEPPVIGVEIGTLGDAAPPASVALTIHRLPGPDAAIDAVRAIGDRPTWTSTAPAAVATKSLPVVARTRTPLVRLAADDAAATLRLPETLDRGWYVVDFPKDLAPGLQVLLQVTPLAGYVASARDRTVVWVDRVGGGPVAGATARLVGGPSLGVTDADGLLVADTPAATYAPAADGTSARPMVLLEAKGVGALLVPLGLDSSGAYHAEVWDPAAGRDPTRWAWSLATDRTAYRRSDSIAAWGIVRDLQTDAVPPIARLTLASTQGWGEEANPAIVTTDVTPTPSGAFSGTLAFDGVPAGAYTVSLAVDGTTIASTQIQVQVIRKPAYRLAVTMDRRAAFTGDQLGATVAASFYDGTPVVGLTLRVSVPSDPADEESAPDLIAMTGPDGTARVTFPAVDSGWVAATTSSPELGDVSSPPVEIAVFPSTSFVALGTTERVGRAVVSSGLVSTVDLPRVEAALAAGRQWRDDVGPARAGAAVSVDAIAQTWVQVKTGTTYDPVTKTTVPTYDSEERDVHVGRTSAKTGADGRFTVRIAIPASLAAKDPTIDVTATVRDAQGRAASDQGAAYGVGPSGDVASVWLEPATGSGGTGDARVCGSPDALYGLGDPVRLTMRDVKGPLPTGGSRRYLYLQARDGIRSAEVTASPAFARTFDRDAVPSVEVRGVAWDGSTFRETRSVVRVAIDPSSRALDVRITSDQPSGTPYTPGASATITVTTRDAAGRLVPADVVLRGVDQKLYDTGLASDDDPLAAVYAPGSGQLTATWATHAQPVLQYAPGCGGSTGGGGGGIDGTRTDFRDRAFFVAGRTGADGTMMVPVTLPDDLTQWHVAAMGVSDDLHVGTATDGLTVGLPFFVAPVLPDSVLASDAPSIVLRAYGSALRAGDPVKYTIRMPELGTDETTASATAFQTPTIAIRGGTGPALPLGTHPVTVMATAHTEAGDLSDAMTLQLEVLATREGILKTSVAPVQAGTAPPGASDALTTCTFADAGRASLAPLLDGLVAASGPRSDQASAAARASSLLVSALGRDSTSDTAGSFDPGPFIATDDGFGVAVVPGGSTDLETTALAVLGAPTLFPVDSFTQLFSDVANDRSETRERRIVALTGLAAAGEPVADDLRAAATASDLTPIERAWIAVGLGEAGDLASALDVEQGLLAASGERSGGWARIRTGTAHDSVAVTALLAIAAARVGDPLAPDLAAYVAGQTDPETVHPLEQVAYAERALARMPRTAARLGWTLGERHETADLAADGPLSLTLTPEQRTAILLQPLEGDSFAACSWTQAAAATDLPADPSVHLKRTVTPSGSLPAGTLVTVDLWITFGEAAPSGLYEVTETLPSGLAPIDWQPVWSDSLEEPDDALAPPVAPWSIDANRARWSVAWDPATPATASAHLRTVARVVAPGSYIWEPAIVQSAQAPAIGATVPPTSVTIVAP